MDKLTCDEYHKNVEEINDIQKKGDCRYKNLYEYNNDNFNDLTDVWIAKKTKKTCMTKSHMPWGALKLKHNQNMKSQYKVEYLHPSQCQLK